MKKWGSERKEMWSVRKHTLTLVKAGRKTCSRLLQQGREYNSRDKWEFIASGQGEVSVGGKLLRGNIKGSRILAKLT